MDKFNGTHLIFILSGVTIVSMKTYPMLYTEFGGRDSWIAVICSGILLTLFTCIILYICKANNNYNIRDIYCTALGKTFGNILIWCFILTLFFTLIECTSIEANTMHVNMLSNTPTWFFALFFAIPAIYTVSKGKNAVIIVITIGLVLITLSGINLGILTTKYKNFGFLLPIMEKGITTNFLISILKGLGFFSFFFIGLPFLTEVDNKTNIKKYTLIALLFIIQMEVVSTLGIITTFGTERANSIFYPKLIQTQLINYWGFLESGELYVLLQVIAGWYIKYILTLFTIKLLFKKLNVTNKYYIYVITLLVLIFSFFISANIILMFKVLDIFIYIALINFAIIPIIVYSIFHIRNKKNIRENNMN